MRRLLLLSAVVLAAGCGPKRVPGKVLEKLPYEAKIELLESENDLALAVDRLDEARAEVNRARDQLRRAKDRLRAAEKEVNNASDQVSRDVATLAVTEAEARVQWLRAHQVVNVREEDMAEKNQDCAITRYELARLTAARKAKLEGSEALDPAVFEGQVARCDEQYKAMKEALKETNSAAAEVRAAWDKAKTELAKKTFDARASPYVE